MPITAKSVQKSVTSLFWLRSKTCCCSQAKDFSGSSWTDRYFISLIKPEGSRPGSSIKGIICLSAALAIPISWGTHSELWEFLLHSNTNRSQDLIADIISDESDWPGNTERSVLPGQSLSSEIISAIKSCDLFVLLWSKNSQSSEWVPQEIGIAKAAERQIIPLMLEPGLEPSGFIRDIKYLSVHDDPEKSLAWLQQHVLDRSQNKEVTDFWTLLAVIGILYLVFRKWNLLQS